MSALSPDSRSLIDAAAEGDELAAVDQDRLKGAILGKVAAGAAAATVATTAAKVAASPAAKVAGASAVAAGTASGSTAVVAILGSMVLLAGIGIGTNIGMGPQRAAPIPPPTAAAPAVAPMDGEAASERPAPEPAADEPTAPDEEAAEPAADEPKKVAAKPKTPSVEAKPERTLANEAALLQRAQAEIQAGNSDAALELLEEHQSSYASGAMTEEREAARVFALCAAGRMAEGRAAAQRFLARYPKSPQRGRVSSACAAK